MAKYKGIEVAQNGIQGHWSQIRCWRLCDQVTKERIPVKLRGKLEGVSEEWYISYFILSVQKAGEY